MMKKINFGIILKAVLLGIARLLAENISNFYISFGIKTLIFIGIFILVFKDSESEVEEGFDEIKRIFLTSIGIMFAISMISHLIDDIIK